MTDPKQIHADCIEKIQGMEAKVFRLAEAQAVLSSLMKDLEEFGLSDDEDGEGVLGSAHFGLSEAIGVMEATIEQLKKTV